MKVQKSHLRIALVILVALVIYSVVRNMTPAAPAPGPQPPQAPLIAGPQPGPSASVQIDPLAILPPVDVDLARAPDWGRDPFLFGNETREVIVASFVQVRGVDPNVRSILISSTRRLAIVDGKIVGVGDAVGAYKVAAIEQDGVVFTTANGERRRVAVYGAGRTGLTR